MVTPLGRTRWLTHRLVREQQRIRKQVRMHLTMNLLRLLLSRTVTSGGFHPQRALNACQRTEPNHRDRKEYKECYEKGHDQSRGEQLVALKNPAVWQSGICLEDVFEDGSGRCGWWRSLTLGQGGRGGGAGIDDEVIWE